MTENINKKKSINEIFHDMDFVDKNVENTKNDDVKETILKDTINKILKPNTKLMTYENGLQAATKSQSKWKQVPPSTRADCLHKIWEALIKNFQFFGKHFSDMKSEFNQIIDYFDIYSDLASCNNESQLEPVGVVMIILSNESPMFLLGGIAAAALAAGCSLIVQVTEEKSWLPIVLSNIFSEAGLPEGLFNIVLKCSDDKDQTLENMNKIINCGSFLEAQDFYKKSLPSTFSFICPGNTSAIVLESCDLNAAVDKIFSQTWSKTCNMWTVSTVVLQESIHQKFIQKLKYKYEQMKIKQLETVVPDLEISQSSAIIMHYQDQDGGIKSERPMVKILICRTPKEGVALVNNSRYCLGVSIWAETSSQALEVASLLKCHNVWINFHGVSKAEVPLQPYSFSGNFVIGGNDGLSEFFHIMPDDSSDKNKTSEIQDSTGEKLSILQTIASTQLAFSKWSLEKSKRQYLKDIANLFKKDKEIFEIINQCAHWSKLVNISVNNFDEEFVVCQKKIPNGVIAVFFNNSNPTLKSVASLITPAIAFGNTVILGLKEENSSVRGLVKQFNTHLPKNVLNMVTEGTVVECFASDPNIHALWLNDEFLCREFLQKLRKYSCKTLKKIWVVSKNITVSQNIFSKECLQNKSVWMTNIDQFP